VGGRGRGANKHTSHISRMPPAAMWHSMIYAICDLQVRHAMYLQLTAHSQVGSRESEERRSPLAVRAVRDAKPQDAPPGRKGGARRKTSRRTTSFGPADVLVGIICGTTRQKQSLMASGFG
jgi:hypothetical protein